MSGQDAHSEQWERIARYLAGEATPAERGELEAWLAEDPARAQLVATIGEAIDRARFAPPADLDTEAALARVHQRMDQEEAVRPIVSAPSLARPRRVWQGLPLRAAAAIVVLLGAALIARLAWPSASPARTTLAAVQTFRTAVGETDTVRLADGTSVVLAPASRLVVAAGYGDRERSVRLEGVARFEVNHDDRRPFTVAAGDALIADLGTTFTVRADPSLPVVVSVTAGSVRLAANSGAGSGVILEAGQSGSVAGGVATAAPPDGQAGAVDWSDGRLVFNDAPFPYVAAELRRWYGVQLVAGDSALAARHLTSSFEGEAVESVIRVISLALDARAETRADTVILHSVQ